MTPHALSARGDDGLLIKSKDSPEKIKFWNVIETAAKEIQSWPQWKKDSTWLEGNYTTS